MHFKIITPEGVKISTNDIESVHIYKVMDAIVNSLVNCYINVCQKMFIRITHARHGTYKNSAPNPNDYIALFGKTTTMPGRNVDCLRDATIDATDDSFNVESG